MAGEKNMKKDESATEVKSDLISKSAAHDVASGKDGISSNSTKPMVSLGNATFGTKVQTNQESVGQHAPHAGCYQYYYPGCNGSFTHVDDNGYYHTDGSHTGMQPDNGSLLYYVPGYNPYATSTLVGGDGQCVGQQPYFSSSGYLQHPVPYGSEAMPCYSWDSTYIGDAQNGNAAGFGNAKYGGSTAYGKPNGLNSMKTNGSIASKFSKSPYTQPTNPLSKVPQLGSDFSAGLVRGYQPVGKFPSFSNQKQGLFPHNGPVNYRTNGRLWNGNDRHKPRDNNFRNGGLETELTRGPRSQKSATLVSSARKEELGLAAVRRDEYNLPDFKIEFEKAKFYIIKSYNEDDIHKCIKYHVWSSTPNGNKKLDGAFHEAEAKADEKGTKCPIFLFFSVNGSGQFVGLAEMTGQVDFNKDMDFWQLDKWNGFFPVKWHVVKDVPNTQLRHIILENNENKPVTHSRDTQEIGLKQGLELLKIFKSYPAKTSLLDDFNFYETREKSGHGKKSTKSATLRMDIYKEDGFSDSGERKHEEESVRAKRSTDTTSLINLTKKLSINPCTQKSDAVKNDPLENSIASVAAP